MGVSDSKGAEVGPGGEFQAQQPRHRPLRENAIGATSGIVLGFASAAPGVSLAGVLASLAGASGYGALFALFVGFLPLVGIAFGFYYLNRWRPDVGISYAWIGRIISPYLGAFVGILIILAFVVSNAFSIIPASTTLLTLFSPKYASNHFIVMITGTVFLLAITVLVVSGIRISARFQWVLTSCELAVFTLFGVWAMVHGLTTHAVGAKAPSPQWFTIAGAGGTGGLLSGLLITVFWYSGWETAVVVNEETTHRFRNPGLAGIWALVGVLLASVVLSMFYLTLVSPKQMGANSGTWLADVGTHLAGHPWGDILALAICSSFIGGIQTTIITFGRVAFSMGRDGVLPKVFAAVNNRTKTPWLAMIILSVPSFAMFLFSLWSSTGTIGTVLTNLVSSIGLMFVVYYALTGLTAAWMLRRVVLTSVVSFVTGLLLPVGGALVLIWIGVETLHGLTAQTILTFVVTLVLAAVVVVLSKVFGKSEFYGHPADVEIEGVES
ncbi:MAG: APC family permease [Isosphaeraceae bacterium]|jgi:amino acid transporter